MDIKDYIKEMVDDGHSIDEIQEMINDQIDKAAKEITANKIKESNQRFIDKAIKDAAHSLEDAITYAAESNEQQECLKKMLNEDFLKDIFEVAVDISNDEDVKIIFNEFDNAITSAIDSIKDILEDDKSTVKKIKIDLPEADRIINRFLKHFI